MLSSETKNKNKRQAVAPQILIDFLKQILPFNELDEAMLKSIVNEFELDFFPKGSVIFKQGETEVTHLYLIQKGGVKLYLKDATGEETLQDFRGEGSYIGALPIIHGTKANLNVETVEDTFCFLLPKQIFLNLVEQHARFSQFYLKSFSDKLIRTAYAELREHKVSPKTESTLYLFTERVDSIIKKAPELIPANYSVQDAAKKMSMLHIGSLLVKDSSEKIVGIVTDKDLRTKVIAAGLDFNEPVAKIMARPVQAISANSVCFDALLQMMTRQIHHLAVEKDGDIIGVITSHDIMVLQGTSPLYLFREIRAQSKIEGLYQLAQKVPLVVRNLIEEGAKANNITRMITVLNDHILDKLLTLLQEELGVAPVPFCWLLMGSEGRKEQTFKTDQDNAILYKEPDDENERRRADEYFTLFAQKAIEHLVKCGYPRCPGDIMASNPKWRQPYRIWKGYFDRWMSAPEPQEVLNATIFFDFRPGYGAQTLGAELREHLALSCRKQTNFLYHLAKDCIDVKAPLSFFRSFIVEKDGEHKNRLDIKTRGLVPFVDFARLMSLKHGISETNTLERLSRLEQGGFISRELYQDISDSYEFQMQLRLVHQLRLIEEGREPDNYIDPGELSEIEKHTLKEAFQVITSLQGILRNLFPGL